MSLKRIVNSPLFLVAAVCFFLPFITVACTFNLGEQFGEALGEEDPLADVPQECFETTVTGFQLVMGNPPEQSDECVEALGGEQVQAEAAPQDADANVFAVVAFAAAILGVGLSLLRYPVGPSLAVLLGAVGVLFLFLTRNNVGGDIPAQAEAFVEVRAEYGFWLALLFLVLAAGWGVFRLLTGRTEAARGAPEEAGGEPPTPPTGPPPPPD